MHPQAQPQVKKRKFERRKTKPQPAVNTGIDMEEKLVNLPAKIWQELRDRGFHVVPGNFSIRYFSRRLLPFTYVNELSLDAQKILFLNLCKAMFKDFDSTICKNFAEDMFGLADQEILHDIAAMISEEEYKKEERKASKKKKKKSPAVAVGEATLV